MDAKELRIRWVLRSDERAYVHIPATGASGVDLYKLTPDGWRYVKVGFPRARENEMTAAWTPGTPALVYLPLYNGVETFELGVPPGG